MIKPTDADGAGSQRTSGSLLERHERYIARNRGDTQDSFLLFFLFYSSL